ncbi:hypothetical protein SB769_38630, partial [Burkholderia sp. SIMBA_024]
MATLAPTNINETAIPRIVPFIAPDPTCFIRQFPLPAQIHKHRLCNGVLAIKASAGQRNDDALTHFYGIDPCNRMNIR